MSPPSLAFFPHWNVCIRTADDIFSFSSPLFRFWWPTQDPTWLPARCASGSVRLASLSLTELWCWKHGGKKLQLKSLKLKTNTESHIRSCARILPFHESPLHFIDVWSTTVHCRRRTSPRCQTLSHNPWIMIRTNRKGKGETTSATLNWSRLPRVNGCRQLLSVKHVGGKVLYRGLCSSLLHKSLHWGVIRQPWCRLSEGKKVGSLFRRGHWRRSSVSRLRQVKEKGKKTAQQ